MKWNDAINQGFRFTGACWHIGDSVREARYKKEAARIKKTFPGADYRIVTGTNNSWLGAGSKAILGNDIYIKFQYFKEEASRKAIKILRQKKQEALEEYTAKCEELDARIAEEEAKLAEALSFYAK